MAASRSRPSAHSLAGAFGLGLGVGFLLGYLLRSEPGSRRGQEAGVLLDRIGSGSRAVQEAAREMARDLTSGAVELQPLQVPPPPTGPEPARPRRRPQTG